MQQRRWCCSSNSTLCRPRGFGVVHVVLVSSTWFSGGSAEMLRVVFSRCFVNASPSISASDGVYVAVRLSYDFVPEFEVVVRLTGEWPTGDKLLLGGLLSSYDVMKPLNFKATSALEGTQLVSGLWFSQGSQRVHDGTATLWTTGANVLPQRNSGSRWGCRSTPQGALFIGYFDASVHPTKA